jgi:hypothetical protein
LYASIWTDGYDAGWRGKCEVMSGFPFVSRMIIPSILVITA